MDHKELPPEVRAVIDAALNWTASEDTDDTDIELMRAVAAYRDSLPKPPEPFEAYINDPGGSPIWRCIVTPVERVQ